jgi:hypothetical protein
VLQSQARRDKERDKETRSSFRVTAIRTDAFSDDELAILTKLSGGLITQHVLDECGVRALRSYSFEGVSKTGRTYAGQHTPRFTLVVPAADGNFYGYCYYEAATHSTFPGAAKNFHLKLNEYTSELKFSLGLDTLRAGEAAYIVEGIKDALILRAAGFNAFTLGGVQSRLPLAVSEQLTANNNTLAIVFDTDFAGMSSAKKLHEFCLHTLQTTIITLPKLARQTTRDEPKPALNDIADYVVNFGFDDELRAALAEPALHSTTTQRWSGQTVTTRSLRLRRYLNESPASIAALRSIIHDHPRLYLHAPTGSGKTSFLLRHLAAPLVEQGYTIIVAEPTIGIVHQIEREYHDLNPICITGQDTTLTLMEARTRPCIAVCTYDSLPKLLHGSASIGTGSLFDNPKTLLLVDEAHTLAHDCSYRLEAMTNVMLAMHHAHAAGRQIICMSATPSPWLRYDEEEQCVTETHPSSSLGAFTYLSVEIEERAQVNVELLAYDARGGQNEEPSLGSSGKGASSMRERLLVQHTLHALDADPNGCVVIRLNSTSSLNAIRQALIKHGMAGTDIEVLTAQTRAQSHTYRSITHEGIIGKRVLLITALLDCGVNIYNTNIAAVLLADETNPTTIVQFASRFRAMSSLTVLLCCPRTKNTAHNERQERMRFDMEQFYRERVAHATTCARVNNMLSMPLVAAGRRPDHNTTEVVAEMSMFRDFDSLITFDPMRWCWTENRASIMAMMERIIAYNRTHRSLLYELHGYGLHIVHPEISNAIMGDENEHKEHKKEDRKKHQRINDALVQAAVEEERERLRREEQTLFELMQNAPDAYFEALAHTTQNHTLRRRIQDVFAVQTQCHAPHTQRAHRSAEAENILQHHAHLFVNNRAELYAHRYFWGRKRLLDHDEAMTLVREHTDARAWSRLTQMFTMHQRLHVHSKAADEHVLSVRALHHVRRERSVRAFVASTAAAGCTFAGVHGERVIANAIHRQAGVAERVNAFTQEDFHLSRQDAAAMVDALFHVRYVRERERTSDGRVKFGGYYEFATDAAGVIRQKTIAEWVTEMGLDGAAYTARFDAEIHRTLERVQEKTIQRTEAVCALSCL